MGMRVAGNVAPPPESTSTRQADLGAVAPTPSPSPSSSGPPGIPPGSRQPIAHTRRQRTALAATGAIIAVVLVFLLYAFSGGFHFGTKTPSVVLVPQNSYYSLPGEQYNEITFIVHGTSSITGTMSITLGLVVYVLDQAQLMGLNHNGTVSSFVWSSGTIANLSVYHLNTQVSAGQWSLTFYNPNILNTTVVGFYTSVVLAPG